MVDIPASYAVNPGFYFRLKFRFYSCFQVFPKSVEENAVIVSENGRQQLPSIPYKPTIYRIFHIAKPPYRVLYTIRYIKSVVKRKQEEDLEPPCESSCSYSDVKPMFQWLNSFIQHTVCKSMQSKNALNR